MQLNVLNDLAEAMKALDGKKKSHRFRSHSSIARCASDPVCGGTSRAAGVPSAERNALSGNVAAGTAAMAMTARWMSGLSSGRIPQANCQAPVRSCLDGLSSVGQLHQYAMASLLACVIARGVHRHFVQ